MGEYTFTWSGSVCDNCGGELYISNHIEIHDNNEITFKTSCPKCDEDNLNTSEFLIKK